MQKVVSSEQIDSCVIVRNSVRYLVNKYGVAVGREGEVNFFSFAEEISVLLCVTFSC